MEAISKCIIIKNNKNNKTLIKAQVMNKSLLSAVERKEVVAEEKHLMKNKKMV